MKKVSLSIKKKGVLVEKYLKKKFYNNRGLTFKFGDKLMESVRISEKR